MKAIAAIVLVFWAFLVAPGLCAAGFPMTPCPYGAGTDDDGSQPCSSNPFAQISVPATDGFAQAKVPPPSVSYVDVVFVTILDVPLRTATHAFARTQTRLMGLSLCSANLPLLL